MKQCKSCKTKLPEIPEIIEFSFCPYCGKALKVNKSETKIPNPRQLRSGKWNIELRKEGISITEDTPEKCRDIARAYRAGLIQKEDAPEKVDFISIGEVIDNYIKSNESLLSPSTIRAYKSYRNHHFQALMPLDARSGIDYQRHINAEYKADNSAKTVINAWRLITAAMSAANIEIPNAKNLHMPKREKKEKEFLDYEQINTFLKAIKGKDCELVALLALHSLRLSEILALTKDKIDFSNDIIHVRGAMVLGENGLEETKVNKTKASTRDVPIMIPRLKELLKKCQAEGHIITDGRKRPYDHINKICREAGLPEIGVHGLRHSFASLAYHLAWSEKTTMRIGGWSNNATVNAIYTHLAAQDIDDDVKAMINFYNGDYNHTVVDMKTEKTEAAEQ